MQLKEWRFTCFEGICMQQNGDLSVIQNVGYPNPARSHFRSQEIWQPLPSRVFK
jgi:hypothetical protein